jgi:hypothetical protein
MAIAPVASTRSKIAVADVPVSQEIGKPSKTGKLHKPPEGQDNKNRIKQAPTGRCFYQLHQLRNILSSRRYTPSRLSFMCLLRVTWTNVTASSQVLRLFISDCCSQCSIRLQDSSFRSGSTIISLRRYVTTCTDFPSPNVLTTTLASSFTSACISRRQITSLSSVILLPPLLVIATCVLQLATNLTFLEPRQTHMVPQLETIEDGEYSSTSKGSMYKSWGHSEHGGVTYSD